MKTTQLLLPLALTAVLAACAQPAEPAAPQTEAAAAARKALTVANNQYKAGIVAYLNVLSAQTSVLSAERSLIDVRNRRLAAVNTLLKNVAGSWEDATTTVR